MTEPGIGPSAVLGVYDPFSRVGDMIRAHIAEDLIVLPSAEGKDGLDAHMAHLTDKELLLSRSTHVIIMMDDIGSLSMLTGALRRLLDGQLKCVMAVGNVPLGMLLQAAKDDQKGDLLDAYLENGKFMIIEDLKPSDIDVLLAGDR